MLFKTYKSARGFFHRLFILHRCPKITGDEKVIKEKTREWYELIENICKSANGCTSDLNKYNSLQEAETGRNQMLENYKNQNKYNLEMVEFK